MTSIKMVGYIFAIYLMEADENDLLKVKSDENHDVQLIPIDEIDIYSNEPNMKKRNAWRHCYGKCQ